jgi:hypothetical protein
MRVLLRVRCEKSLSRNGALNIGIWHVVFFCQAVRDNRNVSSVEKIQHSILHVALFRSQFVNPVSQKNRQPVFLIHAQIQPKARFSPGNWPTPFDSCSANRPANRPQAIVRPCLERKLPVFLACFTMSEHITILLYLATKK